MSSFLLVSLYEFKQFLQIVLWIALPLTLLAVLLTTILHYRRKKKKSGAEAAYPDDIGFHTVLPATGQQTPDWLTSGVQPDNMSLIKKYEQEVRRSRENYAVLEDDFRSLEKKYSDLLNRAYSTEKQEDDYVNTLKQEVADYKQEIGRLKQHVNELNESGPGPEQDNLESIPQLQATIQQLQEALREQQEKKESLASEISKLENLLKNMEFSANGARSESADLQHYFSQQLDDLGKKHQVEKDELKTQLDQSQTTLNQLQEEKTELKSRLNELQYLQDVVEEKKLQTDFLQNQLEQRIKSYHQVEQEIAGWQQAAEQSREESRQTQNAIREKIAHIESLEFNLQEAQQQQAALQSVIDDKQDVLISLQDAIAREQQKAKELENKLEVSNQLLAKIYGELAKSFNTNWQNGNGTPGILNGANGHLTAAEEYHFEEAHAEAIH